MCGVFLLPSISSGCSILFMVAAFSFFNCICFDDCRFLLLFSAIAAFFFAFIFSVGVFRRWCVAAGIAVSHRRNHMQEKSFVTKPQQQEVRLPYIRLVFFRSVLFVRADVIHQVSFLVLLLIAVLCVFQEVKRLQIVIWNPAQSEHFNPSCSVYQVTVRWGEDGWMFGARGPGWGVCVCVCVCVPLGIFAALRSIDQVLQVLILHRSVLLRTRQAEQRANPLSANIQDGVCVSHFLKVPERNTWHHSGVWAELGPQLMINLVINDSGD